MRRINSFAPILGAAPCVLILGSMPSVASLEKKEYYGKPQNAFWRIMGELFGAGPELPYAQRASHLAEQGVAVWDVLASCVRPGSLDSAIDMQTAEINDIAGLLAGQPGIRQIFFNGKTAEAVFRKRVLNGIEKIRPAIRLTSLPSTSPAMAALRFEQKLAHWQAVLGAVNGQVE